MHARHLVAPFALSALLFGSACGGPAQPDGGTDARADALAPIDVHADAPAPMDAPADVATDAAPRDAPADAGTDAPLPDDVPTDVPVDAGHPSVFLLVAGQGDSSRPPFGSAFTAGAWAPLVPMSGSDFFAPGGIGVTVLADGRGLAVVRSNGGGLVESATWSAGAWRGVAPVGGGGTSYVGRPVATATGAIAAPQSGVGAATVFLDAFADATSAWTTGESTGIVGDNRTLPAAVLTRAGAALVLDASSTHEYRWALRTGATWSAPAVISGVMPPDALSSASPAIAAVCRVGVDQVVAVFSASGATSGAPSLAAAAFAAGAWSPPSTVATDLSAGGQVNAPSLLVALPDGRVALAYLTTTNAIRVGFFDGTTWGAFRAVPGGVTTVPQASPFGVARGADPSAVLELAYVDAASRRLMHTRLTAEASWTWTAPAVIDATHTWEAVAIAVGP